MEPMGKESLGFGVQSFQEVLVSTGGGGMLWRVLLLRLISK